MSRNTRHTARPRALQRVRILRPGLIAPAAILIGTLVALAIAAAQPAAAAERIRLAQTDQSSLTREQAKKRRAEDRRTLGTTRKRARNLSTDLKTIEQERAAINKQLVDTARLVQNGEVRLSQIEDRLGELDAQRSLVTGSLLRQHESIGKLLAALQRMGRNPPPVMVTPRRDALAMIRSAMLLSKVFPELKGKAEALSAQLEDLTRVVRNIKLQSEQLREQNRLLAESQIRLDGLSQAKRARFVETQQELAEVRRIARAQTRSVNSLEQIIANLDAEVARKTTLGSYERKLKAGTAPGQNDADTQLAYRTPVPQPATRPAPSNTPAPRPAVRPSSKAKPSVRPKRRRFVLVNPARKEPARPFAKTKGTLPVPAAGRRIFGFGDKTRFGARSKGVAIQTRTNAQITSPSDGYIVFAGPFRSFRQLLILNAGGGYHILLAGMDRLDVSVGQFVHAGEPVGKMKPPPSGGSKAKKDAPILYIEFRHKKRPINPDPWWSRRSNKV